MNCSIFASDHDHSTTVRENPYWGPWHCSPTWLEVRDLMHDYGGTKQKAPTLGHADCFARRKRPVPYRIRTRLWQQNEDAGDTSLMGLWNNGK
jgi:hypothetical protein